MSMFHLCICYNEVRLMTIKKYKDSFVCWHPCCNDFAIGYELYKSINHG